MSVVRWNYIISILNMQPNRIGDPISTETIADAIKVL